MTRIESHLRTLAERTWRASVEARMSGDVERSRALLAESRALDARASENKITGPRDRRRKNNA